MTRAKKREPVELQYRVLVGGTWFGVSGPEAVSKNEVFQAVGPDGEPVRLAEAVLGDLDAATYLAVEDGTENGVKFDARPEHCRLWAPKMLVEG